jgi:hypothetical protein
MPFQNNEKFLIQMKKKFLSKITEKQSDHSIEGSQNSSDEKKDDEFDEPFDIVSFNRDKFYEFFNKHNLVEN